MLRTSDQSGWKKEEDMLAPAKDKVVHFHGRDSERQLWSHLRTAHARIHRWRGREGRQPCVLSRAR